MAGLFHCRGSELRLKNRARKAGLSRGVPVTEARKQKLLAKGQDKLPFNVIPQRLLPARPHLGNFIPYLEIAPPAETKAPISKPVEGFHIRATAVSLVEEFVVVIGGDRLLSFV